MVVIVDIMANIVWVGYLFCAFKASFNFYQKPLVSHHFCYIKINLAYLFLTIKNISIIIYNSCHQTYLIMAICIINNTGIIIFAYSLYYRVIYYIQSFNYQQFSINHLAQLVTYICYLQIIIKNNLLYLHQPLHHCISFEYVFIVWHHCGEL